MQDAKTSDVQLISSANNCWDLFNAVPQDIKTRIVTLGLIELVNKNYTIEEREMFFKFISGNVRR